MKTVTVIIGNSDDKLTQAQFHQFFTDAATRISELAHHVHFCGAPSNHHPWQNVAWVFEVGDWQRTQLKEELAAVGKTHKQDAVAWIEGETQFI